LRPVDDGAGVHLGLARGVIGPRIVLAGVEEDLLPAVPEVHAIGEVLDRLEVRDVEAGLARHPHEHGVVV